jgi:D-3-phosphoglycerate dehydrogenase / 2-oxoglutarate reductase
MHDLNAAVTIRSFDTGGAAYKKLSSFATILSVNTTGRHLSEQELIQQIRDADVVIAGTERYTRNVIASALRLKIISRVGIGLDSLDLVAAKDRGITVLNTPGSTVRPVVEHTLALIFSLLKRIPDYNTRIRGGDFSVRPGTLLFGKKIGIIGIGRIGTKVAESLEALGCEIGYFDPYVPGNTPRHWRAFPALSDLVMQSDIITIHSSAQQGESSIINKEVLSSVKKGIIIINTARGSLIDEKALIDGLSDGRIIGAGLDVFPMEPYSGPLLSFPQVIATPHVASNTTESREQMEMEAVDNIIRHVQEMRS